MKRIAFVLLLGALMLGMISCDPKTKDTETNQNVVSLVSDNVEIYYFHYTRRCITCNAVEEVTKSSLNELYPAQMESGKIVFESVNLDDEASKAVAEKCQAEGQALILLHNGERVDLTDKGFMYAKSTPEKLKEELKTAIDALL